jgi:hypothetical protein
MRYGIGEILKMAAEAPSKAERIDILRKYGCPALYTALRYALDPNVKWGLPEGAPPYTPSTDVEESRFYYEVFKLYRFVDSGDDFMNLKVEQKVSRHNLALKVKRRQLLFVNLLESISPLDAELLLCMKDKKLPYSNLSVKLIKETFPGLIPEVTENEDGKVSV